MKKWMIFLVILCIGALTGLIASNIVWSAALDKAQTREEALHTKVEQYELSLKNTKTELANTRNELEFTETEIVDVRDQLKLSLQELETIKDQVELTKVELQYAKMELQAREEYYKQKLEESQRAGYEAGKKEVMASGILLKRPTRQELIDQWYLIPDAKVIKTYTSGKTVCVDLAVGFNNSATEDGFQVGIVFLVYSYPNGGKWGHFINAFKTEDGIVYIDPQNHKEVIVEVGKSYSKINGFERKTGDIIKEIIIIW